MSKKQTDHRFWRIKSGEPIPEWLQKGATAAGMVAGDDLIVIPSETEGYDVYMADPNSSRPMMKVTAENMPEGFSITGAPTCFRTTSSLHYTIGTLRKENEALADALRGLLKAYENVFDWSAELLREARWFVEVYDNRESNSEVDSLLSRIDAILRAAPQQGEPER